MRLYLCHAEHVSAAEFNAYVVDLGARNKVSFGYSWRFLLVTDYFL